MPDEPTTDPRNPVTGQGSGCHPVGPAERYEFITVAPIVIEVGAWIGAAATIRPGVRIGHDSVVGAGVVVAKDVPPLIVVSGAGYVEQKHLEPAPASEL